VNSGTVLVERWNSVGGTVRVEQWNNDGGTVWWYSVGGLVEQCGGTLRWNSGIVLLE